MGNVVYYFVILYKQPKRRGRPSPIKLINYLRLVGAYSVSALKAFSALVAISALEALYVSHKNSQKTALNATFS